VVINQTASGCEVTSEVSTIIINEVPTITTQPIGSDICLDGAANTLEVVTENGVGTPTYQWYASTTNTYDLTNPIAGETNSTYTPPTNTVGEVFYFVVISFDGGCSDIQSTIALVNINQFPVIDFDQITIYSEETFLFDPNLVASNIVPAGTTYTWSAPTSSTPGAILGSSAEISPQTNISQTLENIEIFPVIETYIITPATPNCTGNPFTLEVTVNPKIISNVLVTNNTCFESNDGVITTNITGGVPFTRGTPYLISWTGPNSFTSTASSISNLMAGIYTLRIEDRNGVSITEQYTVTQPDLLAITTDLEQNISCFEGSDGAIEISISGGTLSYSFKWTTTDGAGIVQGNEDQSGLNAGTYNLELTDNNACVSTKTFILTEPKAIRISTVLKEDILCFGDATGAIEIAVTGGTPIEVSSGVFEYTYSWSGPNGFTSNVQNISNLFIGTYTIEVTDELGCLKRTDIELTQPTAIEIDYTKTDATCYGGADGSIDVTVTGGRPPYQISWSNLGNSFSQSNLSAGNYVATIVDENKCEANVTITIEQPIFFIESIVSPISCNNASDASIVLNLRGGIAPFTVLWSDDPSAGLQRNNLSPGTYSVTIADSAANQCPIQQTFLFTDPPVIGVSETITDATDCNIVNSGSINLNVSGGTKPYSFLWNTNQITKDLTNIPPGDYSVEIKDKNNCVINKQFSIYRQEPIEVEFLVTEIPDCDLKTVSQRTVAKVTGGFPPYTYSWSAGSVSITDNTIMTTSQQGSYTLTITDGKGCTESKIFLVDLPTIGNADYSYDAFSIDNYNLLSIEDPVQFTNLTIGNYSNITWDFGDGSPTTSDENPVHIYDQVGIFNVVLKIELDFGCIEIIEKTLNITQGYVLINPNAFTPNNDGYNETIRPSFTGFKEIEMTIYDTWGVPIYYENNLELNGWDGTIKGLPAENGNYVMVVKGNTFYEKKIITITALTLLK
jgi:gliding motility-associated-like protein